MDQELTPESVGTNVDTWRNWKVYEFVFDSMKLDKDLVTTITVSTEDSVDEFEYDVKLSFVANPRQSERKIRDIVAQWKSTQTSLDKSEDFALAIQQEKDKYVRLSNQFPAIDMPARIVKYSDWSKTKITFRISNENAIKIRQNINSICADYAICVSGLE